MTFQLKFDIRLKLDSVMDETNAKISIVMKFKALIGKIMEEENATVLYPYSATPSAVPITSLS